MAIQAHTHVQSAASATWTISHGLGCYPVVGVKVMYLGALTAILPSNIAFPDKQTVVISFTGPQSGEARLA